jgi:hypothetical protein
MSLLNYLDGDRPSPPILSIKTASTYDAGHLPMSFPGRWSINSRSFNFTVLLLYIVCILIQRILNALRISSKSQNDPHLQHPPRNRTIPPPPPRRAQLQP